MLNLVVRRETARLLKVKSPGYETNSLSSAALQIALLFINFVSQIVLAVQILQFVDTICIHLLFKKNLKSIPKNCNSVGHFLKK
jgi:hypothetical protein